MTALVAPSQPTVVPPTRSSSYWQRRIARHVTIALTTLAGTALFWRVFSARRDLISHLSIATAYPALFLTAAAVLLGPWNVVRRRPNPTSFDLRRDIGIWTGIMAIAHTAIGLFIKRLIAGFVPRVRAEAFEAIRGLQTPNCPFSNLHGSGTPHHLTEAVIQHCIWVKPERRCEVGFMERTKSGRLRHAEFRRLI